MNYRQMQGSGVNTYKWVNKDGKAVLIKYHWEPLKQGIKNLTQKEADEIQAKNVSHATQDLYEETKRGDYPEWEFCVQVMSDHYHLELDFDPLDDTKLWPTDKFSFLKVGTRKIILMKLSRQRSAGVLVDGLDFLMIKCCKAELFPIRIPNDIA